MLKLIKPLSDGKYSYWEFWEDDDYSEIFFHEGEVGDEGETTTIDISEPNIQELLETLIAEKKQDGFQELDMDTTASITIQYVIDGFGTEADLNKRKKIMDDLDDLLEWTGNGSWTAAHVGANIMDVNCNVIDIEAALKTIMSYLQKNNWLEGAVIADETEDNIRVLFPEGAKFYQ